MFFFSFKGSAGLVFSVYMHTNSFTPKTVTHSFTGCVTVLYPY